MAPSISTLYPPADPRPAALALRLNPEVLHQLQSLQRAHKKARLVVKDGKYLIKVSDSLLFPCLASPETLRLDVYSPTLPRNGKYAFTGTVTSRLNVLSDPKQIREHARAPSTSTAEITVSAPLPAPSGHASPRLSLLQQEKVAAARSSSFDLRAYTITPADSDADRVTKLVSLVALGPMTRPTIEEKLQLQRFLRTAEIDQLLSTHTQPYLRKDTFTDDDVYPLLALGHAASTDANAAALPNPYVILKDKAYKELRPWQWDAYTDYERQLILKNCNHALSRLGFLDTHPLRLRIVERSSPARSVKKLATLGGGLLVSSSKKQHHPLTPLNDLATPGPGSPVILASAKGRASTESPKLTSEARRRLAEKGRKPIGSPLRHEELHPHGFSGLALSLSSDDEKHPRKHPASTTSKRHSNASTQSNSSVNSNSSNSYTLPSSVNDDGHLDQSDHDVKPQKMPKPSPAPSQTSASAHAAAPAPAQVATTLPNRPSSSFTNHEKKQQYYSQLAEKFRLRYKEYERLHKQLSKDSRKNSHNEKKKSLMKLFELHNTLSEWKRRLWDYHNENNMAEGVMNLSKHRKLNSLSKISALAPLTSKVASSERFNAAPGNSVTRNSDMARKQAFYDRPAPQRTKFALDY